MPSQHPSSNPDNLSTSEKKKRTKFITIAIVGFLILVIVGMLLGFISDQDEPPAPERRRMTTLFGSGSPYQRLDRAHSGRSGCPLPGEHWNLDPVRQRLAFRSTAASASGGLNGQRRGRASRVASIVVSRHSQVVPVTSGCRVAVCAIPLRPWEGL